MKTSMSAAPKAKPIPIPSDVILGLSSSAASSISSRTIELVCSATCLTAAPTPCESASWVGMSPPIDELREHDPGDDRGTAADERVRAALLLRLLALAELWARRRQRRLARLLIRRRFAL